MIRLPKIYAALALCTLLCGCLKSAQPLSDPAAAAADTRLYGVWRAQADGDLVYLHVGPGETGMTDGIWVEHGSKDAAVKVSRYAAFTTHVGDATVLNVKSLDDPKNAGNYDFVKYRVDGNRTLTLWTMSEEFVKNDIRQGKLKGTIEPGSYGDATIAASGKELVAYIASADQAKLFGNALKFTRAAGGDK